MVIFDKIKSFLSRKEKFQKVNLPLNLSPIGYSVPNGLSKPGVSQKELLNAFRSWVFLCVTIRAEAVAKVRFRPYKENFKEKKVIVPTRHIAQTLLDSPNPYMTRWYFNFLVSAFLDLCGHAYAYIARDAQGVPRQLWLLPPDKVRLCPSLGTEKFIDKYILDIGNGKIQEFDAYEILHIKQPNPSSNYYGFSTTEAAAYFVDVNVGQQKWQKNFFDKDAMPDYVLTSKSKINLDTREEFLQKWIGWFGGSDKKRRVGYLDDDTQVQVIRNTAVEMQFQEQNIASRNNIFAMFRVPLSYAGIDENITARATAESMDYKFYSTVIEPRIQMIEGQLQLDLLNVWFTDDLKLTHDNLIPTDEERNAKLNQMRIESGTTTINEVREESGLPPVEGGDTVMVRSTLTSLDNAIKGKEIPTVPDPNNGDAQNGK